MKCNAIEPRESPGSVLVIGYGNPLRGDDALGFVVADKLIKARPQGMGVIRTYQLTPEIAEPLSRVSLAIFVHATCDWTPARVRCQPIAPEKARLTSLCHHLNPQLLLGYAQSLYGRAPEAWSVTVGGEVWGYCDGLFDPALSAVPKVLHQIDLLIAARIPPSKSSPLSAAGA
jgi:hydrogenase maturation protease